MVFIKDTDEGRYCQSFASRRIRNKAENNKMITELEDKQSSEPELHKVNEVIGPLLLCPLGPSICCNVAIITFLWKINLVQKVVRSP